MDPLTPLEIAIIAALAKEEPGESLNHAQILNRLEYDEHLTFREVLDVCTKLRAEGILSGFRPRKSRYYMYKLSATMREALERVTGQ